MSKNVFDIQRSRLAAGKIHQNVKLESYELGEASNGKTFIKFVFVSEDLEEFSHFAFATANQYGAQELSTSLVQILSCFEPVGKIHGRMIAASKNIDPEEMDHNEILDAFYKTVVDPVLSEADLTAVNLDIKLMFAHHNNNPSFPDALYSKYKFITVTGREQLEWSPEKFKKDHKKYPGELREPQTPRDLDTTDDDDFATAPMEDDVIMAAPAETIAYPEPDPIVETKVETPAAKPAATAPAPAPVAKKPAPAPVSEPAVADPFGDAINLPDDDDFPV